jgi:hypothetical protein
LSNFIGNSGFEALEAANDEIVRKYLHGKLASYRIYNRFYIGFAIATSLICILTIFICFTVYAGSVTASDYEKYVANLWVLASVVLIIISVFFFRNKDRILLEAKTLMDVKDDEETRLKREANSVSSRSLTDLADFVKQYTERIEVMARESGDVIINGNINANSNATLIIGSNLVNSMNKNPESADALKKLAGFVQETGNDQAKLVLNELLKRQAAGEDKVVTGALWERLLKLLPALETIPDIVVKLSKLFLLGT